MSGQEVRLPEEQLQQFLRYRQEEDRYTENLNKLTAQLEVELRNRRTKFITRREISQLNEDAKVYQSVGKAFLLETVPETVRQLREDLGKSDQRVLKLKQTGIYIVGQRDDVRTQINEIVKPYVGK